VAAFREHFGTALAGNLGRGNGDYKSARIGSVCDLAVARP